jgi:hypothetical protein
MNDAGAAYVFQRVGSTWSQEAYLKASNAEPFDNFGSSSGLTVAVSGNTVVVGCSSEDSSATGVNGDQSNNGASTAGAAYVFVREGSTWSQQAYLKASNTGTFDQFGDSVAISGEMAIVGAPGEGSSATGINGDQANNDAVSSGAAYLFVRQGKSWTQQAYVKASNTGATDLFGSTVAISEDTALVGAISEDSSATGLNGDEADNSATDSGAVYEFTFDAAPPSADLDGDGDVDGADLGLMLANWGGPAVGDINLDGVVDGADLGILLAEWTG